MKTRAADGSENEPSRAEPEALPEQADARGEHEPGCDRVRGAQPRPPDPLAEEEERQRAEPGRERREQRRDRHGPDVDRHRAHHPPGPGVPHPDVRGRAARARTDGATSTLSRCPASATELERKHDRTDSGHRLGPCRLGCRREIERAGRRRGRGQAGARPALRAGLGDRRGRRLGRARALGGPRERRDAARRARAARAPLQRPSAPDVHARPRSRAARRCVGRRVRRDGGGAGGRVRAGRDARPAAVRAGRFGADALPRRRGLRLQLPRHAPPRRDAAVRAPPARRRRRSSR